MSFITDIFTGEPQAEAARSASVSQGLGIRDALRRTRQGQAEAQGFLRPFSQIGQQGIAGAGILTDPQQQFDFLQQNPLFQLALDEAQRGTQQTAAATGRLSAGDTLEQLSRNTLLAAQPLLAQQQGNVSDLLRFGGDIATRRGGVATGAATTAGNLLTGRGDVQAAGTIGAATARAQGAQNLLTAGLTAASGGFPVSGGGGLGFTDQLGFGIG